MNFLDFRKGMKKHFGITKGVNLYIDTLLTSPSRVYIDIILFDDWLESQYIEEELSMEEVIEKHYGTAAVKFIKEVI